MSSLIFQPSNLALSFCFYANSLFSGLFPPDFLLRDYITLVEHLGDVSWEVIRAACCHMALVFAIVHLSNVFNIVSDHLKKKN